MWVSRLRVPDYRKSPGLRDREVAEEWSTAEIL